MPRVIKGDAQTPSTPAAGAALVDRKVIDRAVFSAQQEAEEQRRAAERKAADRRARGEQEKQAAYQAAQRAGNLAGLAEVGGLVVDGYFQRAQQLRQAVDDCLLISRHICSKILGRDPKVAESEERRIASEILLQAVKKQRLVIGISSHDFAALERGEPKLLAALAEAPEFGLECAPAVNDGSAALRAGEREFAVPLAAVLDRLCKVLILPKVKLQFALADDADVPADAADAAAPAGGDVEPAVEDEYTEEPADGEPAYDEEPADEPAYDEEPADEPAEASAEAEPGTTAEPRRREESVGMHDISRLVAEIDAEDEDK